MDNNDESGYFSFSDPYGSPFSSSTTTSPKHVEVDDKSTFSKLRTSSSHPEELLKFRVEISEGRTVMCQTNGKESIIDMVQKELDERKLRKKTDTILFKSTSKGYFLNLGLPTGALKEEDYQCIYKKDLSYKTTDSVRKFEVKEFEESWNIKSFYIKFDKDRSSQPFVSEIQRIVDCIQVPFFEEETLYVAMMRDGRFPFSKNKVLRKSCLKLEDNVEVSLSNLAKAYDESVFTFHRMPRENDNLPKDVCPLPKPCRFSNSSGRSHSSQYGACAEVVNVADIKTESENIEETQTYYNISSTNTVVKLSSDRDLQSYIKDHFGFAVEKQQGKTLEDKRKSEIKRFFKNHNYANFALKNMPHYYVCDMKNIMTMSDSVGAVMVELQSGEIKCFGTCFRIGTKYVITNYHVVEDICKQVGRQCEYVDFNYGETDTSRDCKFKIERQIVYSPDLDYAILDLSGEALPPSLNECGYVIPIDNQRPIDNIPLTFIGHPGGTKKQIDVMCPIKSPENLDPYTIFTITQKNEMSVLFAGNRVTYDVGTFFHGSSGSPGVLMNDKLLMVLHCRGFFLNDVGNSVIEQGIMMSAIWHDVYQKIGCKDDLMIEIFGNKSVPL